MRSRHPGASSMSIGRLRKPSASSPPPYYNTDTDTYVQKVKPTSSMEAVIITVALDDVITAGSISATRYIDNDLLVRLASLGVTPECTRLTRSETA